MQLTFEQLEQFQKDGFLILPDVFDRREIQRLRRRLPDLFAQETPANIREKHSEEVRSAMALHERDELYKRLVRHPRLIKPAKQIAGEDVYIQQVKVNVKSAFSGDLWQWHYDFATHHSDDGVKEPLALNLHIFLADVNEYNGPLYFIPGSHKLGPLPATLDTVTTSYPLWVVNKENIAASIEEKGIVSATGSAGTLLIFGDYLVHGSPPNMSPWERPIFSLIVNPISNAQTKYQRPDYIHHRNITPVSPLSDDCLLD